MAKHLVAQVCLKSGVTLRLERDAVLLASTNHVDYAAHDPVWPAAVIDLSLQEAAVDAEACGWTTAPAGSRIKVDFGSRRVSRTDKVLSAGQERRALRQFGPDAAHLVRARDGV